MLDVIHIESDTRVHSLNLRCLAAIPIHLGPPCDAGFDPIAKHVVLYKILVILIMLHGMRTRADNRHFAFEYIEELRQFIKTRAPQKASHFCYSRITLAR